MIRDGIHRTVGVAGCRLVADQMSAPSPGLLQALAAEFWHERDEDGGLLPGRGYSEERPDEEPAWNTLDSSIDSKEDVWLIVDALVQAAPSFDRLPFVGTSILEDADAYFGGESVAWVVGQIREKHGEQVLAKILSGYWD